MQKTLTIKESDFEKVKKLTNEGWAVMSTVRVSDSKIQYTLVKPDIDKKIKG